jgi:hypothetical protein
LSFDTWNFYHRWIARIVVLEAIAHTLSWMIPKVEAGGWKAVGAAFPGDTLTITGLVVSGLLSIVWNIVLTALMTERVWVCCFGINIVFRFQTCFLRKFLASSPGARSDGANCFVVSFGRATRKGLFASRLGLLGARGMWFAKHWVVLQDLTHRRDSSAWPSTPIETSWGARRQRRSNFYPERP